MLTLGEVQKAIEQLKREKGLTNEQLMVVFKMMYDDGKIDFDALDHIVGLLGYQLNDDFRNMSERERKNTQNFKFNAKEMPLDYKLSEEDEKNNRRIELIAFKQQADKIQYVEKLENISETEIIKNIKKDKNTLLELYKLFSNVDYFYNNYKKSNLNLSEYLYKVGFRDKYFKMYLEKYKLKKLTEFDNDTLDNIFFNENVKFLGNLVYSINESFESDLGSLIPYCDVIKLCLYHILDRIK